MQLSCFTLALAALLASAATDRTILITPTSSAPKISIPCLDNAFYGRYGHPQQDVYLVSDECAMESTSFMPSGSMSYLADDQESSLVWLQDAGVDESLISTDELPFADRMYAIPGLLNGLDRDALKEYGGARTGEQVIMSSRGGSSAQGGQPAKLLHLTSTAALVSVPNSLLPILDTVLPSFVVPVVLPAAALQNVPVDEHATERLQSITTSLKFDPSIASILSQLDTADMKKDIRYLTGESDSGILSRHSFSSGAMLAADWIQGEIEKSGAVCEQKHFRYATNTNSTAMTILSAHYDSRGSFGSLRAPGGDDDGSGTTLVLAVARVIKQKRIVFEDHFELVLFAGEEQGLLGSKAYAHDMRKANANITLHIQSYRSPTEPLQLGLPAVIGTPEAAYLVANVSKIYVPDLTVGYSYACCSDHQSFHEQGFAATQLFERAGPIIDPMYHNSRDLSNRPGYDFEQLLAISKVALATILEVVGFDVDDRPPQ
ncbi:hypothetical protein FRB97_007347 [Tulasnella sp. 331]|nr:hypothetical protein FRB97_007347 [Tulasnella sp. 331]